MGTYLHYIDLKSADIIPVTLAPLPENDTRQFVRCTSVLYVSYPLTYTHVMQFRTITLRADLLVYVNIEITDS
jgi:hypothetical protein